MFYRSGWLRCDVFISIRVGFWFWCSVSQVHVFSWCDVGFCLRCWKSYLSSGWCLSSVLVWRAVWRMVLDGFERLTLGVIYYYYYILYIITHIHIHILLYIIYYTLLLFYSFPFPSIFCSPPHSFQSSSSSNPHPFPSQYSFYTCRYFDRFIYILSISSFNTSRQSSSSPISYTHLFFSSLVYLSQNWPRMFYRSGWLRCVGFNSWESCSWCFTLGVILFLLLLSYTILFLSLLSSLPNIPLSFPRSSHSQSFFSHSPINSWCTYLFSPNPIFRFCRLKVVRELTWIVLRLSFHLYS
jgi:hypothetical protein